MGLQAKTYGFVKQRQSDHQLTHVYHSKGFNMLQHLIDSENDHCAFGELLVDSILPAAQMKDGSQVPMSSIGIYQRGICTDRKTLLPRNYEMMKAMKFVGPKRIVAAYPYLKWQNRAAAGGRPYPKTIPRPKFHDDHLSACPEHVQPDVSQEEEELVDSELLAGGQSSNLCNIEIKHENEGEQDNFSYYGDEIRAVPHLGILPSYPIGYSYDNRCKFAFEELCDV